MSPPHTHTYTHTHTHSCHIVPHTHLTHSCYIIVLTSIIFPHSKMIFFLHVAHVFLQSQVSWCPTHSCHIRHWGVIRMRSKANCCKQHHNKIITKWLNIIGVQLRLQLENSCQSPRHNLPGKIPFKDHPKEPTVIFRWRTRTDINVQTTCFS